MSSRTAHAEVRAWERYGFNPTGRDWDIAVQHIIGRVIGEDRPAMRLRLLRSGKELWAVRLGTVAVRAVYCPDSAAIVTLLPEWG